MSEACQGGNGSYRRCRRWLAQNGVYCVSHVPKNTSEIQQPSIANTVVTIQPNVNQVCDTATSAISSKYDQKLPVNWK